MVKISGCRVKFWKIQFEGKYPEDYQLHTPDGDIVLSYFTFKGFFSEPFDNDGNVLYSECWTDETKFFRITREFIRSNYEEGYIGDDCAYGEIDGIDVVFNEYDIEFPEDVYGCVGDYMVKDMNGFYRVFSEEEFNTLFEIV